MDRIRSPYNFVPVSRHVFFPAWAEAASQDRPFEDAVSGTLRLRVETETPLFVRGADGQFCRTPDGKFAIPGSSLRGMLRNVVEVATFGKLGRFNDHRYGVRDLQNREVYCDHMAKILDGRPTPLVTSGWLRKRDDEEHPAEILPCDFAKIEYELVKQAATEHGVRGFDPGRRQSASNKYERWGGASLAIACEVDVYRGTGQPWLGFFGRVKSLGSGAASRQGTLVFTGQPQKHPADYAPRPGGGKPKHHDFVFFDQAGARPILVAKETFRDFCFIHSNRGQQNRADDSPNEEWKYWKGRFDARKPVPVFFLTQENDAAVRAFGLAMMFRLAYRHSVGDAVHAAQPECKSERLDWAETIFGRVEDQADAVRDNHDGMIDALKSRISIGLARHVEGGGPLLPVSAVLGAPKASYYPTYLEQVESEPGGLPPRHDGTSRYSTFMAEQPPRVRGWKRYRPQQADPSPRLPARANDRVTTTFAPLPTGSVFEANLRVHNLRRRELGALLWALDFGGHSDARHLLGMARPLGYGRVRLAIAAEQPLRDMEDKPVDLSRCTEEFVAEMERSAANAGERDGWLGSEQIFQLIECAKPLAAGSDEGRYMQLDHPRDRNEFTQAKKDGLALRAVGSREVLADYRKRLRSRPPRPRNATTPLASTASPLDFEDRKLLTLAYQQGQHPDVLRAWVADAGPREQIRKAIAGEVVTFISKRLAKNHPDLVRWFKPEQK